MTYIKAKEGPPNIGSTVYTVQYFDEEGNMCIRSGGSKAWRNNNPVNIIHIPRGFAARHGAIGHAGGMAIFPDESIGRQALTALLKTASYQKLSISALPERYDKHNASEYRRMLLSISKLNPEKRVKDLSEEEFKRLQKAIERIEGWKEEQEDVIDKWYITGVHKRSGVITEYCVNQSGNNKWFLKRDAIQLAIQEKLHAVVVCMKRGTVYLRPKHRNHPFVSVP